MNHTFTTRTKLFDVTLNEETHSLEA